MDFKGEYFEGTVALAGREGQQQVQHEQKRECIRQVRRLLSGGGFGSAGAVWLITPRKRGSTPKRTLIFQAHVRKTKQGKDVVKVEEL